MKMRDHYSQSSHFLIRSETRRHALPSNVRARACYRPISAAGAGPTSRNKRTGIFDGGVSASVGMSTVLDAWLFQNREVR